MRVSNWNEKLWKNSWNHLALNNRNRCILLNRKQKSTYAILPLQNVDGVVKGGDNNDKYASMIFANETWNKLGEMGLHDLVFLWPNVNAHGTWKMKNKKRNISWKTSVNSSISELQLQLFEEKKNKFHIW